MGWFILTVALFGHAAICVAMVNQLHATAMRRPLAVALDVGWLAFALAVPALAGWWLLRHAASADAAGWWWQPAAGGSRAYLAMCLLAAVAAPLVWLRRRALARPPEVVRRHETEIVPLAGRQDRVPIGNGWRRLVLYVPSNEASSIELNHKQLAVAGLSMEQHGLRIAHISDLHLDGSVDRSFFDHAVDMINDAQADVVAVTGDIIERAAQIDTGGDILSRLRPRLGAYFVLGNHDLRTGDTDAVRRALCAAGLIDLGGRAVRCDWDGRTVLLAGNELPWLQPVADMRGRDVAATDERSLRMLLAHTPDQFAWARRHRFDLMLAGHTHGGQIRLPLVGPILAPSRHGVKYSAGTFHRPPTIMHVSRGLSASLPLRFHCRPEITLLELQAAPAAAVDVPAVENAAAVDAAT